MAVSNSEARRVDCISTDMIFVLELEVAFKLEEKL